MTKYGAKKTVVDGITFDSKAEANRYAALKIQQHAGVISRLELQPQFKCAVNGRHICTYKADFRYFCNARQRLVTEDVKGVETRDFKLKKKLVEALFYPLTIDVVKAGR